MTEARENSPGVWSLLAGGVVCVAASPWLTLRMLLPGILLLCAVLLAIGSSRLPALGRLLFLTRFWLLALITSVWGNLIFTITAPILCLGLLLDMPAATRHITAQGKGMPVIGIGVITATVLMGIGLAILALRLPAGIPLQWTALMFFMAGSYCASLIPPIAFVDQGRGWRRSTVALAGVTVLLAVNLGGMAQIGAWLWAASQSNAHERAGNIELARTWAQRETEQAERLAFNSGIKHGLERQARLAGASGRIEERLSLNEALLRRDPGLNAVRSKIVRDALTLGRYRIAYDHYWQLPEDACDANASVVMLVLAEHLEDWQIFLKATRHLPPDMDLATIATINTRRAGRGLYFAGERTLARRMLEQAFASGAAEWSEGRLLFFLLLDANLHEKAFELLHRYAALVSTEELGALESLAKGDEIKDSRGVIFNNDLQCLECRTEPDTGLVGGQFTMHFKWLALRPMHPDRRVFVHFTQALYGGYMFQADHSIAAAHGIKVDRLDVGAPIEYALSVSIPTNAPAGNYAIFMGIWDGANNLQVTPGAELPTGWRIVKDSRTLTGGVKIATTTNSVKGNMP